MKRMIGMVGVIVGLVGLVGVGSGCSSGKDDACVIEGTYGFTGKRQSGSCPELGDSESTVTITDLGGGEFGLEFLGVKGGCVARKVGACGLQAKCDITLTDASDPRDSAATVQYSWAFDSSGFTGSAALAFPATKSLGPACTGNYKQSGRRR